MKYQFIDDYRSSFGVEKMCLSLTVSRSGFYRWNQGGESRRAAENGLLLDSIRHIHNSTKGRYGSPRSTAELQDRGYSCSRPGPFREFTGAGQRFIYPLQFPKINDIITHRKSLGR